MITTYVWHNAEPFISVSSCTTANTADDSPTIHIPSFSASSNTSTNDEGYIITTMSPNPNAYIIRFIMPIVDMPRDLQNPLGPSLDSDYAERRRKRIISLQEKGEKPNA